MELGQLEMAGREAQAKRAVVPDGVLGQGDLDAGERGVHLELARDRERPAQLGLARRDDSQHGGHLGHGGPQKGVEARVPRADPQGGRVGRRGAHAPRQRQVHARRTAAPLDRHETVAVSAQRHLGRAHTFVSEEEALGGQATGDARAVQRSLKGQGSRCRAAETHAGNQRRQEAADVHAGRLDGAVIDARRGEGAPEGERPLSHPGAPGGNLAHVAPHAHGDVEVGVGHLAVAALRRGDVGVAARAAPRPRDLRVARDQAAEAQVPVEGLREIEGRPVPEAHADVERVPFAGEPRLRPAVEAELALGAPSDEGLRADLVRVDRPRPLDVAPVHAEVADVGARETSLEDRESKRAPAVATERAGSREADHLGVARAQSAPDAREELVRRRQVRRGAVQGQVGPPVQLDAPGDVERGRGDAQVGLLHELHAVLGPPVEATAQRGPAVGARRQVGADASAQAADSPARPVDIDFARRR
jgi:hypothetical protein